MKAMLTSARAGRPSAAPVEEPAPPPRASVVLGPVRRLGPEEAPLVPSSRSFYGARRQRVFFGRGSLLAVEAPLWQAAPRGCPILDTQGVCAAFTLTVTDQDPDDERWATGEAASTSVTRTVVAPFPAKWTAFSGGREAVYAFPGKLAGSLDQIDEKGEVSAFLQDQRLRSWERAAVVEVGARRFVIGHAEGAKLEVGEALAGAPGKPRTLGPLADLGMAAVPMLRRTAHASRAIEEEGMRPMYGPLVAIPTRDPGASSHEEWALVWIEALAPPFSWPAKTPYRRRGRHDCGGSRMSRSLAMKSVEKRVHITRFEGTRQTADKVVLSTHDFDEDSSPFFVRPTDKGVEINGVTHDRNGKSVATRKVTTPATRPEPMAPDEVAVAASFDEASGEGAVVYWAGNQARWARFDAEGKPRGEPAPVGGVPRGIAPYACEPEVARSTAGWWLWKLEEVGRISLDRGTPAPGTTSDEMGFFPGGPTPLSLSFDGQRRVLRRFDPATGRVAAEGEEIAGAFHFSNLTTVSVGGVPSFLAFDWARQDAPAQLFFFGIRSAPSPFAGAVPEEIGRFHGYSLHQVRGDVAVRVAGEHGIAVTWLKAGKTLVYADQAPKGPSEARERTRQGLRGPLIDEGARMLPPTPGPLIETPELAGIFARCEHVMPTGPGTLAMVCAEAVYKDKPGVRVGIQTAHFHE